MSIAKKIIYAFLTITAVCALWVLVTIRMSVYDFPLQKLSVNGIHVTVQLADTDERRRRGLMWQKPIRYDGMILVFEHPQQISLWMKNTPTPLDVAFVDADWTIIGFARMESYSEDEHHSPGPAIAALEMPQGWFENMNITTGSKVIRLK